MKPYAQELRDRVLAACDQGQPTKQVARRFAVSPAWVRRLKQRRRETGEITPRPSGGRRFGKVDPAELLALWRERKDRTLDEYAELLAARGTRVCGQTVSAWLVKLGLRYKKRAWFPPSGTARTSPAVGGGGVAGRRAPTRGTSRAASSSTRRRSGPT